MTRRFIHTLGCAYLTLANEGHKICHPGKAAGELGTGDGSGDIRWVEVDRAWVTGLAESV